MKLNDLQRMLVFVSDSMWGLYLKFGNKFVFHHYKSKFAPRTHFVEGLWRQIKVNMASETRNIIKIVLWYNSLEAHFGI